MEDNYAIVLLQGIIEDIPIIRGKYQEYADLPLSSIGVDSLNFIQLIMKIESFTSVEIDYFNFDLEEINSLNKLNSYIKGMISIED
ncbi:MULTISPECIES: phosphopantetheine-binding protein [Bacillus cereus group]|uniref:Carrier domain-containing protein n=1 Tax=Bacillus thuringiensis serovar mexicanensis TaxID=180868 RepID=A0A2C9YEU4_BACTU|nr:MULTISPECIES: phosphopantetheine-binding protein [Bacillus cereus group]MEB9674046.1 phosphopantetheine-binding protein [Bacillus anthracis]OTW52667.1 hypothetical protein BK699_05840 [Bacillus thuringiensis serovar mexicanensis]OTX09973.1 hypothetical protein BK705_03715 [Bacillus thuringiensis serovar monterrey]